MNSLSIDDEQAYNDIKVKKQVRKTFKPILKETKTSFLKNYNRK